MSWLVLVLHLIGVARVFLTNHRVKLSTSYAVPDFFRDLANSKGVINMLKRGFGRV